MSLFQTPKELAEWAEERACKLDSMFPFLAPIDRVKLMTDQIFAHVYHIIAPDIRRACEIRAGIVRVDA